MALQGSAPPGGHSLPEPARRGPAPGGPVRGGRARISRCGGYRWWLERCWQREAPRLLFVGLNPSRADADHDDPTLRRLIGFARDWGFGAVEVVNLFSAITSHPAALRLLADPIGRGTDAWIRRRATAPEVGAIWLGWGVTGGWLQRDRTVLRLLQRHGALKRCGVVGVTAAGRPRHPLYLPSGSRLQPWPLLAAEAT